MADKHQPSGRENKSFDHHRAGGAARSGAAERRNAALEVLREMEEDPVLAALVGAALFGPKPSGSEDDGPTEEELSAARKRNEEFVKELLRSRRSDAATRPAQVRLAAAPSEQTVIQPPRKPRLVWNSDGIDVFVGARGDVLVDERHARLVIGGCSYEEFSSSEHPGLKRVVGINWGLLREQLAQLEG
jgi:hypothetical protein